MPAKGNVGLEFCVGYRRSELCESVCEAKQKYLVDNVMKQNTTNTFSS